MTAQPPQQLRARNSDRVRPASRAMLILALLGLLPTSGPARAANFAEPPHRPNIVFILADDK